MKVFHFLTILLLSLLFIGCQWGSDGRDGTDGTSSDDTNSSFGIASGTKYALSGKAENGPCKKPGSILVYPLDSELYQTGNPVYGYINDDAGEFDARGTATGEWAFYVAENLTCYNSTYGNDDTGVKFFSLTDLTEAERNLNPLTTIEYLVAIEHFDDPNDACYQNASCAQTLAHDDILTYFNMPATSVRFQEMSWQGSRTEDAVLGMVDSMLDYNRNAADRNAYMLDIANGVLSNDITLKADIQTQFDNLPIKLIKTNIENKYASLGLGYISPPIEDLSSHTWYSDLLNRNPTIMTQFNIDDSGIQCNSETNSSYTLFAIPFVFNTGIDLSRYIAINLDHNNISIWTHGYDSYDRPGTKVLDITRMNEVMFDDPRYLAYNGFLGDSHGLVVGTEYYIVIETEGLLFTTCEGGLLPFGRKLASNDGGLTWIGNDNDTPFWRKSGLIMFTTD